MFDGLPHPFSDHKIILRLGDALDIPEKAVVYSNEWFRMPVHSNASNIAELKTAGWKFFVGLENSNLIQFERVLLNIEDYPFPAKAPDGYCIDWPSGSISSLNDLIQNKPWSGIFMTFDYGLDLKPFVMIDQKELLEPILQHKMDSELLINPGSKDLTCHICWDSVKKSLEFNGFKQVELTSQESFSLNMHQATCKNYLNKVATG